MDYEYINTVVSGNYTVLASPRPVPGDIQAELARYAANLAEQSLIDESYFCYFSLKREKGLPVLGFGRSQRKRNTTSVAQMTQCAAWDWDPKLLADPFDEIFRFAFYSEEQVDARAGDDRSAPPFGQGEAPLIDGFIDVPIARDAIRAILYGVFSRWLLGKAPVRIAVPSGETGRYARYVLSAAREIYSYFPILLRGEAGFVSRLPAGKERDFSRFSLIFVPEDQADAKALYLDGRNPAAFDAKSATTKRKGLDRFIEELVSLDDPEKRKSFLRSVYQELEHREDVREMAAGGAKQYDDFGEALLLLDGGGTEDEKVASWLRFSEHEQEYPASVRGPIRALIARELEPSKVMAYARRKLPDMSRPEECVSGVGSLLTLCRENGDCCAELTRYLGELVTKSGKEDPGVKNSEAMYRALVKEQGHWKGTAEEDKLQLLISHLGSIVADGICVEAGSELLRTQFESVTQYCRDTDRIITAAGNRVRELLPEEQAKAKLDELEGKRNLELSGSVERQLDQLTVRKPRSPEESRRLIASLERIAEEIGGLPRRDGLQPVLKRISDERDKASGILHSIDMQQQELRNRLNAEENYFAALVKLEKESAGFDEKIRQECRSELAFNRRPKRLSEYRREYQKFTGGALTQSHLLKQSPYLQNCVRADLQGIQSDPIALPLGSGGADKLLANVNEISALVPAAQFNVREKLYSADEIRAVLSLTPAQQREKDKGTKLASLCEALLDERVFDQRHILALSEMLVSWGQKRSKALVWALNDRVADLSARQCRTLMDAMREDAVELDQEDTFAETLQSCITKASNNAEDSSAALNQEAISECSRYIGRLRRGSGEAKKLPTVLIAVLPAAAVLVLGCLVLFLTGVLKLPSKKPAEPEETPAPTAEAEVLRVKDGVLTVDGEGKKESFIAGQIREYYDQLTQYPDSVYEDEEFLAEIGYPTTIDLSGADLTSLDFLDGIKGVQKLILRRNGNLSELPALEQATGLSFVDLRKTEVGAEGTERFREAHPDCFLLCDDTLYRGGSVCARGDTFWDLRNCGIETMEVLREEGCAELVRSVRVLDLSGNPLKSVDGLRLLPQLEVLLLEKTEIDDVLCSSIVSLGQNMQQLKQLYINDCLMTGAYENWIRSLEADSYKVELHLTELREFSGSETVSIGGADYDVTAEALDLSGRQLTDGDLEKLADFQGLRTLDLSDNRITDLSALKGLTELRQLDIRGNQVLSLAPLESLPNLHTLYAEDNPIAELSPEKDAFPALRILSMDGGQLQSAAGIGRLGSVQVLMLGGFASSEELDEALTSLAGLRVLRLGEGTILAEETEAGLQEKGVIVLATDQAAAAPDTGELSAGETGLSEENDVGEEAPGESGEDAPPEEDAEDN